MYFGFSSKHIVPKGFSLLNVFFCILQMLNFVLRLFFLATLPCRSLLFKVHCIVVNSYSFLQLFRSDVWVRRSISHQVSGHSI